MLETGKNRREGQNFYSKPVHFGILFIFCSLISPYLAKKIYKMLIQKILSPLPWSANGTDWASLILRFSFGGLMAYNHGYSKFSDLIGGASDFPDPIGIGVYPSFILTVFVELVCCLLLAVGLFTRFADRKSVV